MNAFYFQLYQAVSVPVRIRSFGDNVRAKYEALCGEAVLRGVGPLSEPVSSG